MLFTSLLSVLRASALPGDLSVGIFVTRRGEVCTRHVASLAGEGVVLISGRKAERV